MNSICGGVRLGGGEPGEGRSIMRTGTLSTGGAGDGEDISRSESWLCVKLGLGESVTCVDGVGVSVLIAGCRNFNFNPAVGLSGFVSYLISSNSSSLGEMQVPVDSLLLSGSIATLDILGDGSGVGIGVGRGVGRGVGISLIGERHLLIPLGTSSRIEGGWSKLLPKDEDL